MQVLHPPLLYSRFEEVETVMRLFAPVKPYVAGSEVVRRVAQRYVLVAVDSVVGSAVSPAVGPAVRLVVERHSVAPAAD